MSSLLAKNGKIIGGLPVPLENLRLLWSNPDFSSNFGAQTISLLDDDYDVALLTYKFEASTPYEKSIAIDKGMLGILDISYNSTSHVRLITSPIGNTITFGDATPSNANIIPVKVYGIKKDSSGGSDSKSYMTVHVNGVTDGNGNYNCGPLVPSTVYGAVFNPASDCWSNGIITPWLYPQSGNKGVFHIHAINWNGSPATGAAVKGDLHYIIDL